MIKKEKADKFLSAFSDGLQIRINNGALYAL